MRKTPQVVPGEVRLAIRENFFTGRVKHCSVLPGEVRDSPSLEVFERHEDVALRDMG